MARTFHTYLLCNRPSGVLYCGVTSDLIRRIHEHRTGRGSMFTTRYKVKRLVWFAGHEIPGAAIGQEKTIKGWPRAWKVNLIEADNPDWRDLWPEVSQGGG